MPCSVLVTGGAGFIGSHLADRLLGDGHRVTVLDNFNDFYDPAIKRANVAPHLDSEAYSVVEGDIRDADLIAETFRRGSFDRVIHLAAMAGVRTSLERPALYQEVNLMGTMNILEACRRYSVESIIFASSSSVYGNNEKVPFSESDRVDNPISPYAATKKSGELMAYTYHHLYGIKTCCLRFFTVYGARQRPEMAIHAFADRIYHEQEILMFGSGQSRRDYTYIDDAVDGILASLTADYEFEIINLGRSEAIRLSDLIAKIEGCLGKKAIVRAEPAPPGDVKQTFADISKARRILGYDPKTDIDRGLELFTRWYIERQNKR